MLPAVLVQLRRPQRVHAPLQRQQLALAVGEDERHEGLLVAHLAHPARHGDEASETGGGLAMMPGHDLKGVAQRADQERVCRVELPARSIRARIWAMVSARLNRRGLSGCGWSWASGISAGADAVLRRRRP
jgi:hypothetical protein